MSKIFTLKLHKEEMKSFEKGLWRCCVALLMAVVPCSSLFAVGKITADGGETGVTACPGFGIELTASGFTTQPEAVDFYRQEQGSTTWTHIKTVTDVTGVFVTADDMGSSPVSFKAVAQTTKEETNVITVGVGTNCPNPCHESSTGDFINGTDFNPKNGSADAVTELSGSSTDNIVSHFSDYDITFAASDCSGGTISNDFSKYFGTDLPSDMTDLPVYSNYYWFSNGSINCTPFVYTFNLIDGNKKNVWNERYYRLTMRLYLKKRSGCNNDCTSAQLKLQTRNGGEGNFYQNADHAEIYLYDDATGTVIADNNTGNSVLSVNKSFAAISLGGLICRSDLDEKLLRMEIHFYGRFNAQNKNPNTTIGLAPMFQQFGNCFQMAVDYVSAEEMSVCMTNSSACIGEKVTVNAAGFPYNAKYVWEVKKNGSWETLTVGGVPWGGTDEMYKKVDIEVLDLGKTEYRVYDETTYAKNESEPIYFHIVGKNCDPVVPSKVYGKEMFCAPKTDTFFVSPVDANPLVEYRWKLFDPDGKEYKNTSFDYGGKIDSATSKRGDTIFVTMPNDVPEGEYTIQVQTVVKTLQSNGTYVTKPTGDPVSMPFDVYRTPSVTLKLDAFGDIDENEKKLCPTDKNQKIKAVATALPQSKYLYEYTWVGATSDDKGDNFAIVNLPTEESCNGTKTSHTVNVKVEISGVGCPSGATQDYQLEKLVDPTVDCESMDKPEYELDATAKDTTITLPYPNFEAGCENDPAFKIELVFTGLDGTKVSKTIETSLYKVAGDVAKNKVTLPAGSGTLTYTVTDGCGKTATCNVEIVVKDVTAPSINCDDIKSVSVDLDDACTVTFSGTTEIAAPVLTDQNGVDGAITGVYQGRTNVNVAVNPGEVNTSAAQRELFTNPPLLTDAFQIGTTYILWSFSDNSGNTTYCTQKVTVVDKNEPDVDCKAADLGEVSSSDDHCGLSLSELLKQIPADKMPEATDVCSGAGQSITPEYYYYDDGGNDVKITDFDAVLFNVNESYTLIWRFRKVNSLYSDVYVDCEQEFSVVDKTPPTFDCSLLENIRVTANYKQEKNKSPEYDTYASNTYNAKVGPEGEVVATLNKYFKDQKIRVLTAADVEDNCDGGKVTVKIELAGKNEEGVDQNLTITTDKQLQDHKFGIGLTTITYTFTDASNNTSSCTQSITVTASTTPIPDCPSISDTTIYVDENCLATFVLDSSKVTTAQIPVNQTGYWFNIRAGENQLNLDKSTFKIEDYFPGHLDKFCNVASYGGYPPALTIDYLCEQTSDDAKWKAFNAASFFGTKMNDWSNWHSPFERNSTVISESSSLTTVVYHKGYPYEVELLNPDGSRNAYAENPYGIGDSAPKRVIEPRWKKGKDEDHYDSYLYACESVEIKATNNFPEQMINATNLTKGDYRLVYRFQNEKGGEELDSCVVIVHVVDSMAPKLDCGDWNNTGTFAAGDNCKLDASEVSWFKQPTAADLNAKDNCSAQSELKVSWERTFDGYSYSNSNALTDAFPMGTTVMKWIVEDASGNQATCTQTIIVNDNTGPKVNCDDLKPITAYAGDKCEADKAAVVAAGLVVPEVADDACSPTGGNIKATGVRSDDGGKGLFDPYPLGETTIIWTFTDAAGNPTTCTQTVTILDNTKPDFDCSEIKDTTIKLAPTACAATLEEVKAALKSHTAQDVCDGDIPGVPHVKLSDGTLDDLANYPTFKKDTSYAIVWTFTDKAGNVKECSQLLTIADTTKPDLSQTCKEPEKDVAATVNCSLTYDELNLPTLDEMTLIDDCDGKIVPSVVARIAQIDGSYLTFRDEEIKSQSYPVTRKDYPHIFYWIYKDKGGNVDTCQMLVNVIDNIPPVLVNCENGPKINLTVSTDKCDITPEEVKDLLIIPYAYDECDDYLDDQGQKKIEGVVYRYFVEEVCETRDANDVCLTYRKDTVLKADGKTTPWDADPFPRGETILKWVFTDATGNSVECKKSVVVEDHTPPIFDCDKIDPDTLRPEAPVGTCEMDFKYFKADVLDNLSYKAYDACTEDSVPGVLVLSNLTPLPDDFLMEVGKLYKFLWKFSDQDNNYVTCPQFVQPMHQNDLNVDCNTWPDTVSILATKGECEINSDSVAKYISTPKAEDVCTKDSFDAVPYFFAGADIVKVDLSTQLFATGDTTIHWQFVSPWNLKDTAWCEQVVHVAGNKEFKIDCETLTPTLHDTVADCDPTDPTEFVVDTPWVADPCLTVDDAQYKRYGVGTRSDGLTLADGYPLGNTQIKWVFTDFTGSVDTFCVQDIEVRTKRELEIDCTPISQDTIKVDAAVGACTVDGSGIYDEIMKRDYIAYHPCLDDPNKPGTKISVKGVASRKDGKDLNGSYYVGLTQIIWTFTDTTNTLAVPVARCTSYVQVGDVNEMPVDCDLIPDTTIRLAPNDCEISWSEFKFADNIPAVVDLCSGSVINPIVTRSNGDTVKVYTDSTGTGAAKKYFVVVDSNLKFEVGTDTLFWKYVFEGTDFSCEQVITVKDSMAPVFNCDDIPQTTTVEAPTGVCEAPVSTVLDALPDPWPTATEACTNEAIPGKVYLDRDPNKQLNAASKFEVSVGKHELMWVFIDESINEIGDTCYKDLIVKSDLEPLFDCDTLPLDTFRVIECDTILTSDAIPTPVALDACTKDSIKGVGVRSDGKDLLADAYPVGTTTITWTFTSPFSTKTTTCDQDIVVLSYAEPLFDCSSLDTIRLDAEVGKCYAHSSVVTDQLDKLNPMAKDSCTGIEIPGVYSSLDGSKLPNVFYVGDTTIVKWTFFNDSLNVNPKICYQAVIVASDIAPEFDCDTLNARNNTFYIENCDTTFDSSTIPVPVAIDACTKDSIWGVGVRSDGKDLWADAYPVGTTTITWTFDSPFSKKSVTCDQPISVLSNKEIIFDCSTIKKDSIPAGEDVCDVSDVKLNGHTAEHPCPAESGVRTIVGVPSISGFTGTITANADSSVWTIDKIHVGTHTITWTFADPSNPPTLAEPVKTCEQILQVGDNNNASVDCDNFRDTTIKLNPEDCDISWDRIKFNIPPVVDRCSNALLDPVVSRSSGKAITAVNSIVGGDTVVVVTADSFTVGIDTIWWKYPVIGAECHQVITVKDSMAPLFDCDNFKPDTATVSTPTGECKMEASAVVDSLLKLFEWPYAIEQCTKDSIKGRVLLDGITELTETSTANVSAGIHELKWIFIDETINEIGDTCTKYLVVKSNMEPDFDCESLSQLNFVTDECSKDLGKTDIPTPEAKDHCVPDSTILGTGVWVSATDSSVIVDANGDPVSIYGTYPVGTTIIKWTFVSPFSNATKSCYQNVSVLTTKEVDFDCESLADKTIHVPVDNVTEMSNPDEETSWLDLLYAQHPCPAESGVTDILGVPSLNGTNFAIKSDSSKWIIPALAADTYKIVWTFTDPSNPPTMKEPSKVCEQTLIVEDLLDTLTCPEGLNKKTIACVSELPKYYETFDEFVAAGGSITGHGKFDKSTFGHEVDSTGVLLCDETRHITYYVIDVRKNKIACTDTVFIKDTIPPAFIGTLDELTLLCSETLPAASQPTVEDCNDFTLTPTEKSQQGTDPMACDYYTYDVSRVWVATDVCKNKDSLSQTIHVVDTIKPTINLPLDWGDSVLSIYRKGCIFEVPDFVDDLRRGDVLQDDCIDDSTVFTIVQTPAAGSHITETTIVSILISDPCSNDTTLTKRVYAPKRSDVVDIEAYDTVACVSDDTPISLMDQNIRYAEGSYLQEDDWDHQYYNVGSTFFYDIYRGEITDDNLVYSTNKYGNSSKFERMSADERRSIYELKRKSKSDTYWFVALDTATLCADTAVATLTLRERPRISMESGLEHICEFVHVDSTMLNPYFSCVNDMGAQITAQGWLYGDSVFDLEKDTMVYTENNLSFAYYATNECGTSTSLNSYAEFCGADMSADDSLAFAGSQSNYELLRNEKYVRPDSVLIVVHRRYNPDSISITTDPHDPPRIWLGELVELTAHTDYQYSELVWYRVAGEYDRRNIIVGQDESEFVFDDPEDEQDEILDRDALIIQDTPQDTAKYYITLSDGVCPSVASPLTQVNVIKHLPTAFTPYVREGLNDVFMERHKITIFDRYGSVVFIGDDGWPGTKNGKLADPGVYFYTVIMTDGSQRKGTVELVYLK